VGLYLRYHEGEKAVSQVGTILRSAFNVLRLVVIFIFIRNIISILVFNSLLTVMVHAFCRKVDGTEQNIGIKG
jgi:hypothetical protein